MYLLVAGIIEHKSVPKKSPLCKTALFKNHYNIGNFHKTTLVKNTHCMITERIFIYFLKVHQMNEERLDYEIHVLRKHEEEIVLVKSEQKRKITVLQDTINKLRRKVRGMFI